MEQRKPKLAVCWIWSSPFCFTQFVDSILALEKPDNWEIKFFRGTGWCPARRHNNACERALAWGSDYILILGSDQLYDPDLLKRLTARVEEGYEVISAMVPCRGAITHQPLKPFQPSAWRFKTNNELGDNNYHQYRGMALDQHLIKLIDPKDGDVQRIDFIGSGVLMFSVWHLLALKRPWFKETIEEDSETSGYKRTANQDCVFVHRLRTEAYAECWVDTTIKVRHLHIFEIDETFSDRFPDWHVDAIEVVRAGMKGVPDSAISESTSSGPG